MNRKSRHRNAEARSIMANLKTVRPTGSYLIEVPEHIHELSDGSVSSYWVDGKPLLLQLSSYVRVEGAQVRAWDRLQQRMAKHTARWEIREERLYPETSVDQATAEFLDDNGVVWIHSYLVWPHLTIYSTISGPEADVRKPDSWATQALMSLRLVVH